MAQLDVSDILADPDFVEPLTLIRRLATVTTFGQNSLAEQGFPVVGCVQPASGKTLSRLPEALRVIDTQSFWMRGKIVADGCRQYPDIIVKKGQRYTIQMVFDWSDWGQGWCEGVCVREKPSV